MTDKHKERRRAEEQNNRQGKGKAIRRSIFTVVLIAGIFSFVKVFGTMKAPVNPSAGSNWPLEGSELADASLLKDEAAAPTDKQLVLPWNLILINSNYALPRTFTVDLETVAGARVDTRITEALEKMLADAREDGVEIIICSAYRNVAKQTKLYNEEVAKYRSRGYSEEESRARTGRYIQPPGYSEHHTGLALDLVTPSYQTLDSGFENTEAFQWLNEHAADYGFILRYPEDKEDITNIDYEPWHFRYVGIADAKRMADYGYCLEEYVESLQEK